MYNNITYQQKVDFVEACMRDPVFFVESMLVAEDGKHYILEEHQKEFLRCQESYRMMLWARRLSKSTSLRFDILHKTFFTPSLRSLVVLPSWSQANDFGNEIQDIVTRSPLVGDMFSKMNATTMLLQNGSRINTASAGKEGVAQLGRGARYLAFDEAQQIADRVYGFIIPIMRGTPGKKYQVFSGTPLGKIGVFWEVYNDAKLYIKDGIAQEVENILEDQLGEKFVVFQRQTAYLNDAGAIIGSGTKRIEVPELKADRKRMGEIDFLREYCLEWMDTIGEVFPLELVEHIMDDSVRVKFRSDIECVAGVDFGKQRHHSVVTVGEVKPDGKVNIIFIKSFPLGTDYKDVAKYCMVNLPAAYPGLRTIVVDQTGVGDAVIERFHEGVRDRGIRVEGFNFAGGEKKKALVEAGVLDMEQDRVKICYNQSLRNEMLSFKRTIDDKTNRISYAKPTGGTDDFVDSMLLCLMANRGTISSVGDFNVVSIGSRIFDMARNAARTSLTSPVGVVSPPVRQGRNYRIRGYR